MAEVRGTEHLGITPYQRELMAFMLAIAGVESGGASDPLTVESIENSGGRGTAKGLFQFLDSTWRGVAPRVGVNASTAAQASGEDQWKVASYLMTQYFKQFGDWSLVSVAWFAGPGRAQRLSEGDMSVLSKPDGYGTTVKRYMDKTYNLFKRNAEAGITSNMDLAAAVGQGMGAAGAPDNGMGNLSIAFSFTGDARSYDDTANQDGGLSDIPPGGMAPLDDGFDWGFGGDGGSGPNIMGGTRADTNADGVVDDDELHAFISSTYPQVLWALDHPELGPLLKEAAENSWDNARLYGALVKTDYWKSHPEKQRFLDNLKANDPATWQQMVRQQASDIAAVARSVGWNTLTPERVQRLTEMALYNSWTANEVRDHLVNNMPVSMEAIESGQVGGELAAHKQALDRVSNTYLVALSGVEQREWLAKMLRGEVSIEAFEQYAQQVAETQFPWMSDQMSRGYTPSQVVQPYSNWVSETLEVPAANVDFRDAKWQDVIYDKEREGMRSLPEVQQYIRENFSEWKHTKQANERYADVSQALLQTFGKVA